MTRPDWIQYRNRVAEWPDKWQDQGRLLICDAIYDFTNWPHYKVRIINDLEQSLAAIEEEITEEATESNAQR